MTDIVNSPRLAKLWREKVNSNEGLFVGYLLAGDPTLSKSMEIMAESVVAGVDILEVGLPSINPSYDGEIIRRAHKRVQAAKEGNVLPLAFWESLRTTVDAPIWVMGYRKELVETGLYLELSQRKLIDGIVLPDCETVELREISLRIKNCGIDVIHFVQASMNDEELRATIKDATVLYVRLYEGTTGDPLVRLNRINEFRERIRSISNIMTVAGFGIRSPERVRLVMDSGFDGVVVGTALVARWEHRQKDSLFRLIADMRLETRRNGTRSEQGAIHSLI